MSWPSICLECVLKRRGMLFLRMGDVRYSWEVLNFILTCLSLCTSRAPYVVWPESHHSPMMFCPLKQLKGQGRCSDFFS